MNTQKFSIKSLTDPSMEGPYTKFLAKHSYASYFQSLEYFNTLKKTPSIHPQSLLVVDSSNTIFAAAIGEISDEIKYLPYLTRRLIFNAPPLHNDIQSLEFLVVHLNRMYTGIFTQVRSFHGFSEDEKQVYHQHGYKFSDHLNAFISLKDQTVESIHAKFKRDKVKGIKKAETKFGVTIQEFEDKVYSVDTFYEMAEKLYKKKRHALKSKDFFGNFVNESNGHVRVAFAVHMGSPIASQLYIIYNHKITAMYTATLKDHTDKYAGDLLVAYLIKKGLQEGCEIFDFGGGGDPSRPYGPRNYKERFGAVFQNVYRLNKPKSFLYHIFFFLYRIILKA